MSAIDETITPTPALEETAKTAALDTSAVDEPVAFATQTCRMGFNAHRLTKDHLSEGVVVPITSNCKSKLQGPAVVSSIKMTSLHSDVDTPVHVSLALFSLGGHEALNIDNRYGWPLFESQRSEFTPLVALHPCETQRFAKSLPLYEPGSTMSDRIISEYGSETSASLKSSVVRMPNETWSLVDRDSTVARVMQANWEQLGLNLPATNATLNGRYIRAENSIVNHVVSELEEQVLSKIPYTELSELNAFVQVPAAVAENLDPDALYNVSVDMLVDYRMPVAEE